MKNLLFHPAVTSVAIFAGIAAAATGVSALGGPLKDILGVATATKVVDWSLVVAAITGSIAGVGRSPISSVDNAPH